MFLRRAKGTFFQESLKPLSGKVLLEKNSLIDFCFVFFVLENSYPFCFVCGQRFRLCICFLFFMQFFLSFYVLDWFYLLPFFLASLLSPFS